MTTLTTNDLARHGTTPPPEDLSPDAIALARRVQSLPAGSVYNLIIHKTGKTKWTYSVDKVGKIESSKGGDE